MQCVKHTRASSGIFPGWFRGVYFGFSRGGGVGDQIFAHLYGQNKKIVEPGGSADPPDPPADAPVEAVCDMVTSDR